MRAFAARIFPARWRSIALTGLAKDHRYRVTYFGPITGDAYEQGWLGSGSLGKIEAPPAPIMQEIMQDWALVLEKSHDDLFDRLRHSILSIQFFDIAGTTLIVGKARQA